MLNIFPCSEILFNRYLFLVIRIYVTVVKLKTLRQDIKLTTGLIDQKQLRANNKKNISSNLNVEKLMWILSFIKYKLTIMNNGIVIPKDNPAIKPKIGIIKIKFKVNCFISKPTFIFLLQECILPARLRKPGALKLIMMD